MPKITFSETEELTQSALEVTENAVLIPVLYKKATGEADVISGFVCTDVDTFNTKMSAHKVQLTDGLDRSYIMAHDLLLAGMTVVVKPITFNEDLLSSEGLLAEADAYMIMNIALGSTSATAYTNLTNALKEFESNNLYNIKFITTGGYANKGSYGEGSEAFALTTGAVIKSIAVTRNDAVALFEFCDFEDESALVEAMKDESYSTNDEKCAYAAPWYTSVVYEGSSTKVKMPGAYGYLKAYANSTQTNANWFAAAGTTRGLIPDFVAPSYNIGDATMHILQGDTPYTSGSTSTYLSVRVNPIYNAGTYGYRIWGNRTYGKSTGTASNELAFTDFLNCRIALCDITKQTYHAAIRTTFEPNDDIVWLNFKSLVNTLLEQMKSGRGLKWYRWKKEVVASKATVKATLTLRLIEAVEDFDVTFYLTNSDVEVEEAEV